ncbi:hypothetical protein FRB97_001888 [Tulasnella sp. 331]|nr:hypothetical protein FRB97_001888 [Tulasnella sp. 331]
MRPQSPSTTSAQESALSIPELLLRILNELSIKELIVTALVCKEWSEFSLDTRYRYRPITLNRLLQRTEPKPQLWIPSKVAADLSHSQKTVPENRSHAYDATTSFGLLPVLPPLEDLDLQVDQLWDAIKTGGTQKNVSDPVSIWSPNANARKVKYIHADLPLPQTEVFRKLETRRNDPLSKDESLCPCLEKLDLQIAQSWLWHPLGQTALLLQGPLGQRGPLAIELKKRLKWLYFTDEHSDLLGKAIPNIRQLIMKQTPNLTVDGGCSHEQTCDLDSLVALAKYAGGTLTHLTASLVVEKPAFSEVPRRSLSLLALKSFTLEHLEVRGELVEWLVGYLVRLCPNLQSFEVGCYMVKQGHEGWKPASTETFKESFFLRQEQLRNFMMSRS